MVGQLKLRLLQLKELKSNLKELMNRPPPPPPEPLFKTAYIEIWKLGTLKVSNIIKVLLC